jgi:hypothetical protein
VVIYADYTHSLLGSRRRRRVGVWNKRVGMRRANLTGALVLVFGVMTLTLNAFGL